MYFCVCVYIYIYIYIYITASTVELYGTVYVKHIHQINDFVKKSAIIYYPQKRTCSNREPLQ